MTTTDRGNTPVATCDTGTLSGGFETVDAQVVDVSSSVSGSAASTRIEPTGFAGAFAALDANEAAHLGALYAAGAPEGHVAMLGSLNRVAAAGHGGAGDRQAPSSPGPGPGLATWTR
ncbi:hypothetical protein [Poseidonocella sp. HB161398]|uniref:hypothetical protein n=1 Tax=Poseidonocella sp. HB161398 TaxID=2320855 RepID=UPI001108F6D5|nr:hypothetical protein [Poseidonocella sp. HB161398]